jgi:hypothetical protein
MRDTTSGGNVRRRRRIIFGLLALGATATFVVIGPGLALGSSDHKVTVRRAAGPDEGASPTQRSNTTTGAELVEGSVLARPGRNPDGTCKSPAEGLDVEVPTGTGFNVSAEQRLSDCAVIITSIEAGPAADFDDEPVLPPGDEGGTTESGGSAK